MHNDIRTMTNSQITLQQPQRQAQVKVARCSANLTLLRMTLLIFLPSVLLVLGSKVLAQDAAAAAPEAPANALGQALMVGSCNQIANCVALNPTAPQDVSLPEIGQWGAIVIDNKGTGKLAFSNRYGARIFAEQSALLSCQAGGDTECHLLTTYTNTCAAVAWAPKANTWYVANNDRKRLAEDEALNECGKSGELCRLYSAGCSYKMGFSLSR